jgi:2-dehydro-3-deoxygluconokinase
MVDVTCEELPAAGTRLHTEVALRGGGSALNAARAAAAAGAVATVVGRIGADPAGDLVLAELCAAGISAHIARDPVLPTGTAVVFPGPTVVATRGANARFAVNDIPEALAADALFVSGFALFQSGSSDAAALAMERFTGAWIGIDVASPALALEARDVDIPTAGRGTVIFATAEEARAMTGAEPEEAARMLASRFSVASVKLGEEGALAVAGEHLERGRTERVTRRSPFGAGDAFAGTFLVALAMGNPFGTAVELACRAGAEAAARSPAPGVPEAG